MPVSWKDGTRRLGLGFATHRDVSTQGSPWQEYTESANQIPERIIAKEGAKQISKVNLSLIYNDTIYIMYIYNYTIRLWK